MYGVGGSGTLGLAEVYAMRKIFKEKMKTKLAAVETEEEKDNVGEKNKTKEMKITKKTLKTNPRVSSADI
ncbi:hypothetical protein EUTSA_v10029113mg [Eutrema salsugineum]|uniref:Uncharacterized protein n=1 Tax=Eutrema salsugineum TaxID=72664 RepID=V4KLE7_EUTSA|nr:uncharacterized protein LOC18014672 [Eutrema salsugineum]ESQ38730.1 hypothetical protein EUTSA_v10029113mg [Eutrema salsugineum]